MTDKTKFREFMAGLGEVFDKKISDTLSSVYWKSLLPFDDETCIEMFERIISTCKFFPKPVVCVRYLNQS